MSLYSLSNTTTTLFPKSEPSSTNFISTVPNEADGTNFFSAVTSLPAASLIGFCDALSIRIPFSRYSLPTIRFVYDTVSIIVTLLSALETLIPVSKSLADVLIEGFCGVTGVTGGISGTSGLSLSFSISPAFILSNELTLICIVRADVSCLASVTDLAKSQSKGISSLPSYIPAEQ